MRLAELARQAELLMGKLNVRNFANKAWALAKLFKNIHRTDYLYVFAGQLNEKLLVALVRAGDRRLGVSNAQGPAKIALGHLNKQLLAARNIASVTWPDESELQEHANMAWALAIMDH
eukprot:gnl/TRDRNA2_/TRDRNA2_150673_c2_seq1.p1 gnl/TRDRNA2_/TRDRNA2_150673_c2~~gnl/TRDRNA2_/TRDRNA2_150673_c2_seq1.p1  ORF type:complete len:118 (-),score=16.99 gnl/TRDRNA2_/TRDRNA2_150673_c2_seq1:79-432(-)